MACAKYTLENPITPAARARANWPYALALTFIELLRWRRGCLDLPKLHDRLLADVGVTREEAERQAADWFARWLQRRNEGA